MEFILVIAMIVAGLGLALVVGLLTMLAKRRSDGFSEQLGNVRRSRESIAASILFEIARAGGGSPDDARRLIREEARIAAPAEIGIDLSSWAQAYASGSSPDQRSRLLELAVKIAVIMNSTIPLAQYNALVDLSFGLGFQTDALARLRARYRFQYVDYAKQGRPRSADRSGGGAPLYQRAPFNRAEKLRVLGLEGDVTRDRLISAYRRLASQHHPDRYHNADDASQHAAAQRFIEVTEAYEALLATWDRG
ncbi:MAG TPA: DnaJ domain-containing protein [Thermoanaerobaculia bacterium]